jgi:hypothetical protein
MAYRRITAFSSEELGPVELCTIQSHFGNSLSQMTMAV